MYRTDTIVGTYYYNQHLLQCHNSNSARQINAKTVLKLYLIQSDRSKYN